MTENFTRQFILDLYENPTHLELSNEILTEEFSVIDSIKTILDNTLISPKSNSLEKILAYSQYSNQGIVEPEFSF